MQGWRKTWVIALAALIAAQTLARMIGHYRAFATVSLSYTLHLLVIAMCFGLIALIVWRLPDRWRGLPVAAPVLTLLLGTAHAFATYADLFHLVWYYFVRVPAPVFMPFYNTQLAFSLLSSIGISAAQAIAIIAALLGVHFLLYAVVADILVAAIRRAMPTQFPVRLWRIRRLPGWSIAAAPLAIALVLPWLISGFNWRYELLHKSGGNPFEVVPRDLVVRAVEPPPLPEVAAANPRPLVLIIVDALRSDRMGIYRPERANTPYLDRLRATGKLHVYPGRATCSYSLCGIMSLLSSRSWDQFGPRPATVLDALARHRYRNHLILSGSHSDFGILTRLYGRGIVQQWDQGTTPPADDRLALRVLAETKFEDPKHSFLYLHLMSTHWGTAYEPQFRPDPREHLYDARVRQADSKIGEAMEILRAKGMLDNALVIITADHGERVFPNDRHFHGGQADEATTAVPILVYDAAGGTWPARSLASQIDVAPTFLRAIGGIDGEGWHGEPLQQVSQRRAVPLGMSDSTGAIVELDGNSWRYSCMRETGEEQLQHIDGRSLEGTTIAPGPDRDRLLSRIRPLHRQATGASCTGAK